MRQPVSLPYAKRFVFVSKVGLSKVGNGIVGLYHSLMISFLKINFQG
jgi:hypothetical protein